ncbi:urate hydroxylase PuuD [Acuticoccus sp. MNP-M23]|uniref:urate hydroxylase PuuD n=1 Tax=Acuticoccus sp. MNP-M23 TaxID=3072793 RepID=UPI00281618AB|nr:urate hydroxylase PuuD [Acuticoccus sp. MNP-M23]WMS44343.1 urate hydroxylase PuuD [Acuticoccus sp. MNP-M23]
MAALQDFLSLFVRWAHVVAAISWIGSSFYFMGLDASLKRRANMPDGVKGDNWTVHGGGFYHIRKYTVAPDQMPEDLHWFKWESYATWMTGAALLAVVYYWNASLYLLAPDKADLAPWQGIALSAGGLVAAWFVYDGLCRSPLARAPAVLFGLLFVLITASAWAYGLVFSGQAAFLQTGAMIATMMAANVFLVIIPNQKIVVADLVAGRVPDAKYGAIAKLRSSHNNYLTLPVIFLMLSNHYPATFGHAHAFIIVAIALFLGAIVRHWFNTFETGATGIRIAWQWPAALALAVGMALFATLPQFKNPTLTAAPADTDGTAPGGGERGLNTALDAAAFGIVSARCAPCHAAAPTFAAIAAPPGGVMLDTPERMRTHAAQIIAQSVDTHVMPLGNVTQITDDERAALAAWAGR